eukprot:66713-Amphidinium_carterae.2
MLENGDPLPYCHRCTGFGAMFVPEGCTGWREVLVGHGALDKTFDLAFETEQTIGAGVLQAGVFLNCSKCYERIPFKALQKLEAFALESGYPLYAHYAALSMYSVLWAQSGALLGTFAMDTGRFTAG